MYHFPHSSWPCRLVFYIYRLCLGFAAEADTAPKRPVQDCGLPLWLIFKSLRRRGETLQRINHQRHVERFSGRKACDRANDAGGLHLVILTSLHERLQASSAFGIDEE
jgi:hypothetical protein